MIISASRRTDIPAYFGEKFYKDLSNGKFKVINPFNNKITELIVKKEEVDGIVFWTKNPFPFFETVKKIKNENYNFYFQYTLNNYPRNIEPLKFSFEERIEHLKKLKEIISPKKIFLRYDPIILNSQFSVEFHIESFARLIEKVYKYIDRVTVSFLTVYRKIKKYFLDVIEEKDVQINLLKQLNSICKEKKLTLYVCCYPENLEKYGIKRGKCVDGEIFGVKPKKHIGQRKLCNCDKSIDIGFYRTCRTGCIYCYAN